MKLLLLLCVCVACEECAECISENCTGLNLEITIGAVTPFYDGLSASKKNKKMLMVHLKLSNLLFLPLVLVRFFLW